MSKKHTRMTENIDRATRSGIIVSLMMIIQRALPFKVATLRTLQHFYFRQKRNKMKKEDTIVKVGALWKASVDTAADENYFARS